MAEKGAISSSGIESREIDIVREVPDVPSNTSSNPDNQKVPSLRRSKEFEKDAARSVTKEFEETRQLLNIVLQDKTGESCCEKETNPVLAAEDADSEFDFDDAYSELKYPVGVKDMKSWLDNPDVEKINADLRNAKLIAKFVAEKYFKSEIGTYQDVSRALAIVRLIERAKERLRLYHIPKEVRDSEREEVTKNIMLIHEMEKSCEDEEAYSVPEDHTDSDSIEMYSEETSIPEDTAEKKKLFCWWDHGPDLVKLESDFHSTMREIVLIERRLYRGEADIDELLHICDLILDMSSRFEFAKFAADMKNAYGSAPKESTEMQSAAKVDIKQNLWNHGKEADPIPVGKKQLYCWWDHGPDRSKISRDARYALREATLINHRYKRGEGNINELNYAEWRLQNILDRMEYATIYDDITEVFRSGRKPQQPRECDRGRTMSERLALSLDELKTKTVAWLNNYFSEECEAIENLGGDGTSSIQGQRL